MRSRCAVANGIEHRPAAHRDDETLATDAMTINKIDDVIGQPRVLLARFAAGNDHHVHQRGHCWRMCREIPANHAVETNVSLCDTFIDNHDRAPRAHITVAGQRLLQRRIRRSKHARGEAHAVRETKRHRAVESEIMIVIRCGHQRVAYRCFGAEGAKE